MGIYNGCKQNSFILQYCIVSNGHIKTFTGDIETWNDYNKVCNDCNKVYNGNHNICNDHIKNIMSLVAEH